VFSVTPQLTPARVGTRSDWRAVDAGDTHVCAVAADGTLWCWGHDDEGQLGSLALSSRAVPTQVGSDSDWKDVACGDHFTCALKTDGTRWCSGANYSGELGNARAWVTVFTVIP
jgi:alpha-tubulin suppressor-like RCC1 family protein